jgi:predicted aldo/keto reductase-like oxidoreductase
MVNDSQNIRDATREILGKYISDGVCRRCGLCLPCPQDINIPRLFLYEQYAVFYRQLHWAARQYAQLEAQGDQCIECGICERYCPYSITISQGMARVHSLLSIEIADDIPEERPRISHCETFSFDKIMGPLHKDREKQKEVEVSGIT